MDPAKPSARNLLMSLELIEIICTVWGRGSNIGWTVTGAPPLKSSDTSYNQKLLIIRLTELDIISAQSAIVSLRPS